MGRKDKKISHYQFFEIDSVLYTNGGSKVTLHHLVCKTVQWSACIQQRAALISSKS